MTTFPTKQELLDLWERTTPAPITEAILGQPGEEIYSCHAAVFGYLSGKMEAAFEQQYLEDADGPDFATGEVKLYWDNRLRCELGFAAQKLTIWGRKHGGRNLVPYVNSEEISIVPGVTSQPLTVAVRAARAGADQDVLAKNLCVLFRNGEHVGTGATAVSTALTSGSEPFTAQDLYRIVRVTAATDGSIVGEERQIVSVSGGNATLRAAFSSNSAGIAWECVELDQAGLKCENAADIIGGNDYNLDMLAHNRGVRRKYGEEDNPYRNRAQTLDDGVSGPAIQRTLTRLMQKLAPGFAATYVGWAEGPETAAFTSETGDAVDELHAIFDDPRSDPALMISRLDMRGWFAVIVPEFYGWADADRERVYRIIYETIERIRAGGVGWTMVADSSLG